MLLEQELSLVEKAKGGDGRAKEILIENNEGLIRRLSMRFRSYGIEEDLYQTACVGFLKAIDSFDPSFGTRLTTYAVPVMVGELRKYLRDQSPMKFTRGERQKISRLMEAKDSLTAELGREPNIREVALRLGWDPGDVVGLLESARWPISLEEEKRVGGEAPAEWLERLELAELVRRLPELEQNVIVGRFYGCLTQHELSRRLGISQSQVSRLEKRALMRLREWYCLDTSYQKE